MDILKYDIKSKIIEGKKYIFDEIRKKYIVLTPEELVRQKFIRFLIEEKGYIKSLFSIESGLKYGDLKKRTDMLYYDRSGRPFLLVECKSFKVPLSQKTFEQLSIYNLTVKARFIGITNGISHRFCQVDYADKKLYYLESVPEFSG